MQSAKVNKVEKLIYAEVVFHIGDIFHFQIKIPLQNQLMIFFIKIFTTYPDIFVTDFFQIYVFFFVSENKITSRNLL